MSLKCCLDVTLIIFMTYIIMNAYFVTLQMSFRCCLVFTWLHFYFTPSWMLNFCLFSVLFLSSHTEYIHNKQNCEFSLFVSLKLLLWSHNGHINLNTRFYLKYFYGKGIFRKGAVAFIATPGTFAISGIVWNCYNYSVQIASY